MAELPPYQERVLDEKSELDEKLMNLQSFILSDKFMAVDQEEKRRLNRQEQAMTEYSIVLAERIDSFPK